MMNANLRIEPFAKIVPMIYAYTTPGVAYHEGWTKIGYTEKQTVEERIAQQTHTAGIKHHTEWSREARYSDGSGEYFTDHDFHDYLVRLKRVEREPRTEWFHIDGKRSKKYFNEFAGRDYEDEAATGQQYELRAEQEQAVVRTMAYFESNQEPREFLWNAKPRFGKTLTAYEFARRMKARSVLIVTNRPTVANSWFDDFERFIKWQTKYRFVSETAALAGRPVLTREEYIDAVSDGEDAGQIAFESLQGLKGSVYFGGRFDKLRWIKDTKWDLLIIDEAHEGVDTYKTDRAFSYIDRRFTLHLSGTPFKAIAGGQFRSEQIFNWSYADEQEAKQSWQGEGYNPYECLPRLSMFTYQLSKMIADKVQKGLDLSEDEHAEYAFDLNEFFSTENGRFKYEADVVRFLDALTLKEKFPFSTPELRSELRHTFWLLDRVDSAKAMEKLLRNHPVFRDYTVVVAAGDGRTGEETDEFVQRSFDRVQQAIAGHEYTITLSVGQLTTGVTVKPWSAVLMLSNMRSPAEYMQAAFRAQNPYHYTSKADGKEYRKENAYVFDFSPERTLIVFDEFANNLLSSTAAGRGTSSEREENVRRLLNFFPVIGEDEEGKMVELDASRVLTIPKAIKAQEVIRRGFMSNFLFANISNVFSAPPVVQEILKTLEPVREAPKRGQLTLDDADDVSVGDDGEVEVPTAIVINKTGEIFGPKVYSYDLPETSPKEFVKEPGTSEKSPEGIYVAQVAADIVGSLKPVIDTQVKQEYKLKAAETDKIVSRLEQEVGAKLQRTADEFATEKAVILTEQQAELKNAKSKIEVKKIEAKFSAKTEKAAQAFLTKIKDEAEKASAEAAQTVVRELEIKKEEKKKRDIEEDVRAHLRGFARTIPSFVMAYGDDNLRLSNFDDYTPDDVFLEVTSISEDKFRFLRDGGDYTDEETGETKHYEGHLFDEVVFDESIREFLAMKVRLANYFAPDNEEDIFDYIPPQQTNQIFTPRKVVKQMVDALEKENPHVFDDPQRTFADLYMKSGLYITELVKRLYRNRKMKKAIPDDYERIKHILEKQVFGLAPTEIIYRIAIAYIFGFDERAKDISQEHFRMADVVPYAKEGKVAELVKKLFG